MNAFLTRVPELSGADILSLPLSALEGFVLSRVDGRAPVREIVSVTGLPAEQVAQMLERLRALGALRWKGEPNDPPKVSSVALHASGDSGSLSEGASTVPPQPSTEPAQAAPEPDAPPLYEERELDEECDLPRDRRRQVLDLYYRLEMLDYYEALELPYDADKKQIRAAYFALSKAFHPDTMFRKNLGSYKAKMEVVFRYLTEAYETLGKKKTRDEYDAYLRATKATKMAERTLAKTSEEARDPAPPAVSAPQGGPEPTAPSAVPAAESVPPRQPSSEARKLAQDVVARRLRGVVGRAPVASSVPPRVPPSDNPVGPSMPPSASTRPAAQDAARRLARTLMDVGSFTGMNQPVERLVKAARLAAESGNVEEALAEIRKAIALAPEREELKREYQRLTADLARRLADEYAVQAQFEAKQGKWASAALAWSKVCEGKPQDAQAHRQAAFALYKVGGDLRSAQRYAQQAVYLAPEDFDARVLLAQIYLTVGLKLNAKRELDAAAKLDPENEMVKNLLSDLKV